ncbi:hypothetical protein N8D56_01950 [Devosia sp. A8/3-2]|nr:hypothetical protein N8D56_01950 [Devosia sp. A8/3-2]
MLEYLGLVAFAVSTDIASSFGLGRIGITSPAPVPIKQEFRLSLNILMIISMTIILFALIEAVASGASMKRELVAQGSFFGTIAGFASVILTCGSILLAASIMRQKGVAALFGSPLIVFSAAAVFFSLVVLGERDYVFRFVFCAMVVYFNYKRSMGVGRMLLLLAALCLVLPVSQSAKGLLLSGGEFSIDFSINSIFVGEFISSARNIYMLLFHGVHHSYSFLANDIARGFLPFGGNFHFQSTSNWYNSVYRVDHSFSGRIWVGILLDWAGVPAWWARGRGCCNGAGRCHCADFVSTS